MLNIVINNAEELEEFKLLSKRISKYGIDEICDIISKSIEPMNKETSNQFILNVSLLNPNPDNVKGKYRKMN